MTGAVRPTAMMSKTTTGRCTTAFLSRTRGGTYRRPSVMICEPCRGRSIKWNRPNARSACPNTRGRSLMSATPKQPIDQLAVNTIRMLSMDAVQQANSGHPGTPIALAPLVYTIWQEFLRYDPADPIWPDRDRFVLSAGHACMVLYSILHLTGVKQVKDETQVLAEPAVPLEQIK